MQVRTRVIDDALRDFVAGGGRQLVLLGAGYDCRALRLPELAELRVFEVDHPATQAHKRDVLAQLRVELAGAATSTWDFETRAMDDLPDVLAEAGPRRRGAGVHDLGRRDDVPDRGRDRRVAARDSRVERARLAASR